MPHVSRTLTLACSLLLALATTAGATGCPNNVGTFDGGILPDAGPVIGRIVRAADIGKPCIYDPATQQNPTNTCPDGLECLIVTRDGAYTPGAATDANAPHMALPDWEDAFSVYRADGKDEGYCTVIGSFAAPPVCPGGTILKLLSRDISVCLRTCTAAADCGRAAYVCDARFLDDGSGGSVPMCVRACQTDLPECVRTGVFQSPANNLVTYLSVQDLGGASQCNTTTGTCSGVNVHGTAPPGSPCHATADCADGSVCYPAALANPGASLSDPGFCGQPCKPDPQNAQGTCPTGFLCQGGLERGFGDPFGALGDDVGMTVIDLSVPPTPDCTPVGSPGCDPNAFGEAGGWCFHQCAFTVAGDCESLPGTSCGSPKESAFFPNNEPFAALNDATMCLAPFLRN